MLNNHRKDLEKRASIVQGTINARKPGAYLVFPLERLETVSIRYYDNNTSQPFVSINRGGGYDVSYTNSDPEIPGIINRLLSLPEREQLVIDNSGDLDFAKAVVQGIGAIVDSIYQIKSVGKNLVIVTPWYAGRSSMAKAIGKSGQNIKNLQKLAGTCGYSVKLEEK